MKTVINHPVYGEIVYEEPYWSAKRTLIVGGVQAEQIRDKFGNLFLLDGKEVSVKGSHFFGNKLALLIDGETILLDRGLAWYEFLLAILLSAVVMIWEDNSALFSAFSIMGGIVGRLIGFVLLYVSVFCMRMVKSRLAQVAVCLLCFVIALTVSHALAMLF